MIQIKSTWIKLEISKKIHSTWKLKESNLWRYCVSMSTIWTIHSVSNFSLILHTIEISLKFWAAWVPIQLEKPKICSRCSTVCWTTWFTCFLNRMSIWFKSNQLESNWKFQRKFIQLENWKNPIYGGTVWVC